MIRRWMRVIIAMFGAGLLVAAAPTDEPVRLKPSRPVAHGIAALPRVVAIPGSTEAAIARINHALDQADKLPGCDNPKGTWNRSVLVTMQGPRYLSLLAADDWYCGGPYPDTDQVALVYDLRTGAPADWQQILPPGLYHQASAGASGSDSEPVLVASMELWKIYAKAAAAVNRDCGKVLANPSGFGIDLMLWPDAKRGGLAMQASFPHVIKACAVPVTIASAELRKLGLAADFVDAIDEAHRRRWYGK